MPLHDGDFWQSGTAQVTLLLQELPRSHICLVPSWKGGHRCTCSSLVGTAQVGVIWMGTASTPVLPLVEASDIVRSVFFASPEKFLSCSIRPLTSSSKWRLLAISFVADIYIFQHSRLVMILCTVISFCAKSASPTHCQFCECPTGKSDLYFHH